MKKTLLLSAALVAAMGAMAQSHVSASKTQNVSATQQTVERTPMMDFYTNVHPINSVAKALKAGELETKPFIPGQSLSTSAPHRTAADGVYYWRPYGTYYTAFDIDGRGYYEQYMNLPAFNAVLFENQSTNAAACTWSINGSDITDYAEANGDMIWSMNPGYASYPLTVTSGATSWTLGENTNYYYVNGYANSPSVNCHDTEVGYMSLNNEHDVNDQYYFGPMDSHYLYGTGTVTFSDGTTLTSLGVIEPYEAPASPLYVEDIYCTIVSFTDQPIPAGEEVTMRIYDSATGDVIATLTATADDYTNWQTATVSYGTVYVGALKFTQWTTGLFGATVAEPFVLDNNFEIAIMFSANSEFGFTGGKNGDEDPVQDAYMIYSPDGNSLNTANLYSDDGYTGVSISLNFNALFDYIEVWGEATNTNTGETEWLNIIQLSDDGSSSSIYGYTSDVEPGAYVYTATDWFDATTGDEHYTFTNVPDWVYTYDVDTSYWADYAVNVISFMGEALPAGTTSRIAYMNIDGRGVTTAEPVIIFQGDPNEALAGISNVIADSKKGSAATYNLAGQRVNKAQQGIVVRDGKKIYQ